MLKIAFSIEGDPRAWTVFTKRGRPTPAFLHMKAWQEVIQVAARAAYRGLDPHEGPVTLEMWFYRAIRASAPKREDPRQRWCQKHILTKPDTTNYQKAGEDALEGILFLTDGQVTDVQSHKRYAEEPRTEFIVTLL